MNGAEIVASFAPTFSGREDGRWPVLYVPRSYSDPQPWVAFGSNPEAAWRYSGTEVEVVETEPRHLGSVHTDPHTGFCGKPAKRVTPHVSRVRCQECLDAYDAATGIPARRT